MDESLFQRSLSGMPGQRQSLPQWESLVSRPVSFLPRSGSCSLCACLRLCQRLTTAGLQAVSGECDIYTPACPPVIFPHVLCASVYCTFYSFGSTALWLFTFNHRQKAYVKKQLDGNSSPTPSYLTTPRHPAPFTTLTPGSHNLASRWEVEDYLLKERNAHILTRSFKQIFSNLPRAKNRQRGSCIPRPFCFSYTTTTFLRQKSQ